LISKISAALKEAAMPLVNTLRAWRDNPRFVKRLDLSAEAIKSGDDDYKLECLARVYGRRDIALKFSTITAVLMLVFLMAYGIIGMNAYFGSIPNPLGTLSVGQMLLPLIIIPSVIASFMHIRAIIATIILYFLSAAYFIVTWHFLIVIPFLIVGGVLYIRLALMGEAYETLRVMEGFPKFINLSDSIIRPDLLKGAYNQPGAVSGATGVSEPGATGVSEPGAVSVEPGAVSGESGEPGAMSVEQVDGVKNKNTDDEKR
jgi:hypothetical protein